MNEGVQKQRFLGTFFLISNWVLINFMLDLLFKRNGSHLFATVPILFVNLFVFNEKAKNLGFLKKIVGIGGCQSLLYKD